MKYKLHVSILAFCSAMLFVFAATNDGFWRFLCAFAGMVCGALATSQEMEMERKIKDFEDWRK